MFCPSCGTKNNYYHRFCFHCGTRLSTEEQVEKNLEKDAPSSESQKVIQVESSKEAQVLDKAALPQDSSQNTMGMNDTKSTIEKDYEDLVSEDSEDEYFDISNQIPLRRYQKEVSSDGLQTLIKVCVSVVLIALVVFLCFIGYDQFFKKPNETAPVSKGIDLEYNIEEILVDEEPASKITIITANGELVELFGETLPVVDGRAELTILDNQFNIEEFEKIDGELDVALDLVIKADGYSNRQETIQLKIPIPYAPLTIVSPSSKEAIIDGDSYQLVIKVEPGAEVFIDDNNYSHLVDEEGQLSVKLEVPNLSEIKYVLRVSARGFEDTIDEVMLRRRQMEFPLVINQTVPIKVTTEEWVEITGNTNPEAILKTNLEVREAPEIDAITGDFKLYVKATSLGYTPLTLTASLEGKEDSILSLVIDRHVDESVYTSTAWAAVYDDLKAYPDLQTGKVFAFTGTIKEISSTGTISTLIVNISSEGEEQLLNVVYWGSFSYTIGQKIRLFGNRWGNENGVPNILAKHIYLQR
ncbi:MAG: zinc ribbon domain-containing protein [Firmicutes bacterium]|nr:zinc ribbon domain-containing protein [Bacillota bacterium]